MQQRSFSAGDGAARARAHLICFRSADLRATLFVEADHALAAARAANAELLAPATFARGPKRT